MGIPAVKREWLLLLLILSATLLLYLSSMGNSVVGMDVPAYETVLYTGDPLQTAVDLFRDFKGEVVPGYYAPLSSVSLMSDRFLVGSQVPVPRVTFTVNLLFHCLNGILLFLLLRRFGADEIVLTIALFVFLIHPVQASGILWLVERKTVMAVSFYLSAYLLFLMNRQKGSRLYYALSLASFMAGLLSKPTVVVLPVLLFVGEILGMHSSRPWSVEATTSETAPPQSKGLSNDAKQGPERRTLLGSFTGKWTVLLYLVPFFVLSVLFGLITLRSEAAGGFDVPLLHRPFIAAAAIWFYLGKIALPIHMLPLYPRWTVQLSDPRWWIMAGGLVAVFLAMLAFHRRISRQVTWSLAAFTIPLLPVIGFLKFGYFQYSFVANHLLYMSMIGIAYFIALLLARAFQSSSRVVRYASVGVIVCYVTFLPVQTRFQAGLWADSIALWSYTVDKCPSCFAAESMLGASLLDKGDYAGAVEHLNRAVEVSPQKHKPFNNLGNALFEQGKVSEAITLFRKAGEADPQSPTAYNNLGSVLLGQGKVSEAISLFERAIEISPRYARAYNNMGNALMKQGKVPEALSNYRKAIQLKPDLAAPYENLGNALMKQGKLSEAVALLGKAVQMSPGSATAANHLGNALLRQGRIKEAVGLFNKAIELDPTLADPYVNLGNAALSLGRIPTAKKLLRKAVEIDPNSIGARNSMGNALLHEGNVHEAVAEFQEALRIDPKSAAAYNNLGLAMKRSKDPDQAKRYFLQAIAVDPRMAEAHHNLARLFESEGDMETAVKHYKMAVEIAPHLAESHYNLANLYANSGRDLPAEKHYLEAIRIRPNHLQAMNNLAVVYMNSSRFGEAEAYLKRALAIAPDFPQAKRNMEALTRNSPVRRQKGK
ncbi:tetratricopeptide repeat protein [Thermodesulfobacteriota bacterium]